MQSNLFINYLTNHASNTWSDHPDIGNVSSRLSVSDQKFMDAVGLLLARTGQARRFGVTLLHSHFHLEAGEKLVDKLDRARNLVITGVQPVTDRDDGNLVPKSWSFPKGPQDGEAISIDVLTWIGRDDLPNRPLDNMDAVLLRAVAALYRSHGVEDRFGMALVGVQAEDGKMWVEGDVPEQRCLVQEQFSKAEVDARNPMGTIWVFDDNGRQATVMGCCLRTQSGNGHTGRKHPGGG